jgi:hypothetical protein
MRIIPISIAATLAILACACASSGPPVSNAEMAQADGDIRAAENATATQHARDLLDRARGDLAAAQRDWQDRRWDAARRRIAEARAAAAAAETKARAVAIQRQAEDLRHEADRVEQRTRELAQQ